VGWIDGLQGKTIGIDTAPLIYFIEENQNYIGVVKPFFEAMDRDEVKVVTSTITLLEVLVHPLRKKNSELASEYRDILLNSKLLTIEVTNTIAEQAAQLRVDYNIRTPDAIQISACLNAGATHFFTNDIRLPEIPSIQMLSLDSLK